jgi:hypothetical protein
MYTIGNPQITFHKSVYRRHTNFAVEAIEQTFNGTPDFGRQVTTTISRNGDLITQIYLEVTLPTINITPPDAADDPIPPPTALYAGWIYGIGNALLSRIDLEIGGQLIDRHYGEWMNIWTELAVPESKRVGYDDMVGNWGGYDHQQMWPDYEANIKTSNAAATAKRLYIPLMFWFNKLPGLALPLIALQYHEVKLNISFREKNQLWIVSANNNVYDVDDYPYSPYETENGHPGNTVVHAGSFNARLYVDYVFLDTDERRRFAQLSHEYLIEQVQFVGEESISANTTSAGFRLNFNHPCKELLWVHSLVEYNTGAGAALSTHNIAAHPNCWFNYAGEVTTGQYIDSFSTCKLSLNGHDRFSSRNADYFRKVQCYDHHTRVPRTHGAGMIGTNNKSSTYKMAQYIYCYSFGLYPEEHQPSGTCNFSRIDTAIMNITYPANSAARSLKIYAINYNVLRIMSGMGGVAYSS